MEEILTCDGVVVHYGTRPTPAIALHHLALAAGEKVALLGLNGSGKTTLLLATAGLIPFIGTIRVCGIPVEAGRISDVRKRLGFLFSTPDDQLLFPRVLDDVGFALRRSGASAVEAEAGSRNMMRDLGAEGLWDRAVHEISQGERLTVALAGALVSKPPLLLLDEPSSSLDPPARKRLAQFLSHQQSSMLIATHDLAFARKACNRFLVLDAGKICLDTPDACQLEKEWGV